MRGYFETPGSDWLCCTQAPGILSVVKTERLAKTPIPKEHTQKLVAFWNKGQPTPLYRNLGIYPGRASREKTA
jgi:hypothetical protein